MSEEPIKSKFNQFIEKIKAKYWLHITIGSVILALLSILANILQLIESQKFKSFLSGLFEVTGSVNFSIPSFLILIITFILGCFWFKERSSRKLHESQLLTPLTKTLDEMKEDITKTIKISNQKIRDYNSPNNLDSQGDFYSKLQELLVKNKNSLIYICCINREWVYKLIFSLYISKTRNNKIFVLCSQEEAEQKRYKLLSSLGCKVIGLEEKDVLDIFRGVVVNPVDKSDCQAILVHKDAQPIFGNYYFGPFDFKAITLFFQEIQKLTDLSWEAIDDYKPVLIDETEPSIIERLPMIDFYRNAVFEFRDIKVADAIPVSNFVEDFKYSQVKELFETYEKNNFKLFHPVAIQLKGGYSSTILPPVLEEKNGKLYVAEGHTRLFYQWNNNSEESIRVIIVKGVDKFFTKQPTTWEEMLIKVDKERLGENAKPLARNIESDFRDEILNNL